MIKTVLFYLVLLLVFYLTGRVATVFFQKKIAFSEALILGFITFLALIEIFGCFCTVFQLRIDFFMGITVCVSLLCIIAGLIVIKRENRVYAGFLTKPSPVLILSLLLMCFLIVLSILYYRADADDAFYVGNVNLFINSAYLYPYESSMGNPLIPSSGMYRLETWEALMAVLCKAFSISASAMMHTIIIPVLLILSFCAYTFLGKRLFRTNNATYLFYIFVILFFLVSGYSVYSPGSFLFSRLWQGKAVYLHLIIPVVLGCVASCVKERCSYQSERLKLTGVLVVAVLAGVALNPTSLYIIGILILFSMMALAWSKRDIHWLRVAIIPEVITFMLLLFVFFLSRTSTSTALGTDKGFLELFYQVIEIFKDFWGEGWVYLILYFAAVVYIYFKGDHEKKTLFLYTPLLLLAFVWNPICGALILKVIAATYWRVFWLMPVGLTLACVGVMLLERKASKLFRIGLAVIVVIVICGPGQWMFSRENGFAMATSVEKLPNEVELFAPNIRLEEGTVLLACSDIATTFCQKYTDVQLVCSRVMYLETISDTREIEERTILQNFSDGILEEHDLEVVPPLLQKYDVDWLILKKSAIDENDYLINKDLVEMIEESDAMRLYSVK